MAPLWCFMIASACTGVINPKAAATDVCRATCLYAGSLRAASSWRKVLRCDRPLITCRAREQPAKKSRGPCLRNAPCSFWEE